MLPKLSHAIVNVLIVYIARFFNGLAGIKAPMQLPTIALINTDEPQLDSPS